MSDYISRGAFIADCEGRYCAPCKEQGKDSNGMKCRACWVDDMLGEVMDAPAADVEPVRHGRWNRPYISWFFPLKIRNPYCFCTYCGHPIKPRKATDYCPNCGAKMDLEDDNEGL